MTYDCATVPVPEDWNIRARQTFDIAMIRVRSESEHNRSARC